MAPSATARDGEWLDFVADLMGAPLTAWPSEQVTQLLVDTFGAAGCGHYAKRGSGPAWQYGWPPEHFAPNLQAIQRWTEESAPREHPILRYYLGTGDSRCIQVRDVPRRFADQRIVQRWNERGRHWGGVQSQLSIPLQLGPLDNRAFVIGRTDPYTPQELVTAHRLQRLLVGLDRQIDAYSRWSQRAGPPAVEVALAVGLTPRELAVLELLTRGHTAAAIGRRLGIAERTVQKHLQHAYAKLGVADRLAAVQRAQTIGVL